MIIDLTVMLYEETTHRLKMNFLFEIFKENASEIIRLQFKTLFSQNLALETYKSEYLPLPMYSIQLVKHYVETEFARITSSLDNNILLFQLSQ